MKKHVILATSAALLSTSAFATKTRMNALGQDSERGSQYLNDTRNAFRNAAHVNNMNNYVVTEWGADGEAEGGMFRDSGNFAYGLYFNDQNGNRERENLGGSTSTFNDQTNRLDLFFGGDAGVQWGARVHYASSENESSNLENDAMGLGFGVLMGDLSAYANLDLKDESTGSQVDDKDVWEADLGLNVGVAYDWNNWTFHADYAKNGEEVTLETADNFENDRSMFTVGAAQVHEISSTSMVFTALDYKNSKTESAGAETKNNALSATIGFEADATSWLTWRGSIAQNVFIGDTEMPSGDTNTDRDSTSVNAGASLTFGKLMVDGTIGATDGSSPGTTKEGSLRLDEVFTNVAVSYWF